MPHKFLLITGALFATVVIDNIKTKIEANKAARLFIIAAQAYEETQVAHKAQIEYLCHMLVEHEVSVDEFDLIVLNYNM